MPGKHSIVYATYVACLFTIWDLDHMQRIYSYTSGSGIHDMQYVPGHYNDVIMSAIASPASPLFTQPFIQGADQRKHQSSESLAFVRGIHRWPVYSPQKGPVTQKMFPFDDVIMNYAPGLHFFAWFCRGLIQVYVIQCYCNATWAI